MVDATIERELSACLGHLPIEGQRQVLEFARTLTESPLEGVQGSSLLRFAGTIDNTSLETMTQAIDGECERIDASEW